MDIPNKDQLLISEVATEMEQQLARIPFTKNNRLIEAYCQAQESIEQFKRLAIQTNTTQSYKTIKKGK